MLAQLLRRAWVKGPGKKGLLTLKPLQCSQLREAAWSREDYPAACELYMQLPQQGQSATLCPVLVLCKRQVWGGHQWDLPAGIQLAQQ